jgi:hypothetical protein
MKQKIWMDLCLEQLEFRGYLFLFRVHPCSLFDGPQLKKSYDHWTGHRGGHAQVTVRLKPGLRYIAESYKLLKRNIDVAPVTSVEEKTCNPPNQDKQEELPYFIFQQKTWHRHINQGITE